MNVQQKGIVAHLLYEIGLILKTLGAVFEIAAGTLAIFITPTFVLRVASWITEDELSHDPRDGIANYILTTAHHYSLGGQRFVALYLLIHGVIKILTLTSLFKKKIWAYPLSLLVFGLFIAYQLYRYTYTQSLWLVVLTVFDIFVVWLIWREYVTVRALCESQKKEVI